MLKRKKPKELSASSSSSSSSSSETNPPVKKQKSSNYGLVLAIQNAWPHFPEVIALLIVNDYCPIAFPNPSLSLPPFYKTLWSIWETALFREESIYIFAEIQYFQRPEFEYTEWEITVPAKIHSLNHATGGLRLFLPKPSEAYMRDYWEFYEQSQSFNYDDIPANINKIYYTNHHYFNFEPTQSVETDDDHVNLVCSTAINAGRHVMEYTGTLDIQIWCMEEQMNEPLHLYTITQQLKTPAIQIQPHVVPMWIADDDQRTSTIQRPTNE
jgi:hypothetical protein